MRILFVRHKDSSFSFWFTAFYCSWAMGSHAQTFSLRTLVATISWFTHVKLSRLRTCIVYTPLCYAPSLPLFSSRVVLMDNSTWGLVEHCDHCSQSNSPFHKLYISDVMQLICTKWGQVSFNLHLQVHISHTKSNNGIIRVSQITIWWRAW